MLFVILYSTDWLKQSNARPKSLCKATNESLSDEHFFFVLASDFPLLLPAFIIPSFSSPLFFFFLERLLFSVLSLRDAAYLSKTEKEKRERERETETEAALLLLRKVLPSVAVGSSCAPISKNPAVHRST